MSINFIIPFHYILSQKLYFRILNKRKNNYELFCFQAKKQHELYVKCLRDSGLDVIELPPDESHPNSVFVETLAVVCNGSALLTKPFDPKRHGEVN